VLVFIYVFDSDTKIGSRGSLRKARKPTIRKVAKKATMRESSWIDVGSRSTNMLIARTMIAEILQKIVNRLVVLESCRLARKNADVPNRPISI